MKARNRMDDRQPAEKHLTTAQAARRLGCAAKTVSNLVDSGQLKGHRIGTHRRIHPHDLLAFANLRGIRLLDDRC